MLLGLMVYGIILVGGATRLTDSGLSITDWKPFSGVFPPRDEAEWIALIDLYKQTAEYRLQNAGMAMSEFQYIYWWEWGHRMMGRAVGVVAILGYLIFWPMGWLRKSLKFKFALLILLGGLQGAIGWWMVSSGIGDTHRVDVAPYRLMTHFCLALVIISYIYWLWMDLTIKPLRARSGNYAFGFLFLLIFLQMASGALVAGLDAGRTYTDWPLMAGEFVPSGYWSSGYGIRNFFENIANAQFNHRIIAYFLILIVVLVVLRNKKSMSRYGLRILVFFVSLQVIWGITTVIHAAPMPLALIHQGLGVVVLLVSLRTVWRSRHSVDYS